MSGLGPAGLCVREGESKASGGTGVSSVEAESSDAVVAAIQGSPSDGAL